MSALINLNLLNAYRLPIRALEGDECGGAFEFDGPCGTRLRVVASNGAGWDHVSVSTKRRCPNWQEMEWVRGRFFRPEATVMQLHVPKTDHINNHPYCLHLWRPHDVEIPRPPSILVGV